MNKGIDLAEGDFISFLNAGDWYELDALENINKFYEDINIPLNKGDNVLFGKFKNKKAVVQDFKKDDKGQPILDTDKGDVQLLKIRIPKLVNGENNENS